MIVSYLDKTWADVVENPKFTEKQSVEVMKKLAVYAPGAGSGGGHSHRTKHSCPA